MDVKDASSLRPHRTFDRRMIGNAMAIMIGDGSALAFCLVASAVVRVFFAEGHIPPSRGFFLIPAWWFGACFFRLVPGWGLGAAEELRRTQLLLITIFGLAALAMFLTKSADITSRLKYGIVYLMAVPIVPLVRSFVKSNLIRAKVWGIPVAVYGKQAGLNGLIHLLRDEPGLGYVPTAYFGPPGLLEESLAGDVGWRGELELYAPDCSVAMVDGRSIEPVELAKLLDGSLSNYTKVIIIPDLYEIPTLWVRACDLLGLLGLEVSHNLMSPVVRAAKELGEYVLVLLTLPFWGPLTLFLALMVWREDRHPPFYAQDRLGLDGVSFSTWKLRTMIPDADVWLKNKLASDPEFARRWGVDFKMQDDPRITRTGRFLRRTSLDELPQLWNVLRGEMALVGPRPLPAYHQEKLPAHIRRLREKVRPGVTGMWQVTGRSETGTVGMERWDAYYVRNWSPWLDIVILVRTFRAVFRKDGAY